MFCQKLFYLLVLSCASFAYSHDIIASDEDLYDKEELVLQLASSKRMKCRSGYYYNKAGAHQAALAVFEDCVRRWNDVYSLIWLAHIYEIGYGVEINLPKSVDYLRRGAVQRDEAEYWVLAAYHYGNALLKGRGVQIDKARAKRYLILAANNGLEDASVLLKQHF